MKTGTITWFVRNPVAANIIMFAIIGFGLYSVFKKVPLEVFPAFEADVVNITVVYSGATPDEVEEGITNRIEDAIADLPGVDRIDSFSSESRSLIRAEVHKRYSTTKILNEIKSRIDGISSFPEGAERAVVEQLIRVRDVITVVIEQDRKDDVVLRQNTEKIRDEIRNLPYVTQVAMGGVRPWEITITVPEFTLRQYGLTINDIAEVIRNASRDIPGGSIKTKSGDILVRSLGQAYRKNDFADINVISKKNGGRIRLGDIATINDGFTEDTLYSRFDKKNAAFINVSRVGDQNAILLATTVKEYIEERKHTLPAGLSLSYWQDSSKIVKARLNTLTISFIQGIILVLILLALFLRPDLAFWVSMGIPIQHILMTVGTGGGRPRANSTGQSHLGSVTFELLPPESRSSTISSREIVSQWRKMIGSIPGIKELAFRAELGRGGAPINVQLKGESFEDLNIMAQKVKEKLEQYDGLYDIKNSFEGGKDEVQLRIRPEAEQLGLSFSQLGTQVRHAIYGAEAQRIQRNQSEVRVMVRTPENERHSLSDLQNLRIHTPSGADVPLSEVATIKMGKGSSTITHVDRERIINITADLNKEKTSANKVVADLKKWLQVLLKDHPRVQVDMEGEQLEQKKFRNSLLFGFIFALIVIYVLLAIPFGSYLQPLMVMSVIPFSVIGAIAGHVIMGMSLSISSAMGVLALIGVVVNDSLVLVDYTNKRIKEGASVEKAIRIAGGARFRPILLTSLTTFAGLTPLQKHTGPVFNTYGGIVRFWNFICDYVNAGIDTHVLFDCGRH